MTNAATIPGFRIVSIALACCVHGLIALSFLLFRPADAEIEPPTVEIEMLAESASEAAPSEPKAIAASPDKGLTDAQEAIGETVTQRAVESDNAEPVSDLDDESRPTDVQSASEQTSPTAAEPAPAEAVASMAGVTSAERAPEATIAAAADSAIATPIESEAKAPEQPPQKKAETKPVKDRKPPADKAGKKRKPMAQEAKVAGSRPQETGKREGLSSAEKSGGQAAAASYRSVVQARIFARKADFTAIANRGLAGTVVIALSIDAAGSVRKASVARSSGHASIDSAVRAMIASLSFPPPPGGSFAAQVPIAIRLE